MLVRRSFLSLLGINVAAFGAGASAAAPQAQSAPSSGWQPTRHAEDDWLDQAAGKHRLVFDTTTADGLGQALLYVNNYLALNEDAYGLKEAELAVLIIARHRSTPYAFNDAMWAKYGKGLTQMTGLNDPNTKQPPAVNVYNASAYGATFLNRGILLDGLLKRGVRLAVCEVATRTAAAIVADAVGGNMDAITAELIANRVANSRMVPAGIVTVNRAQERGYTFAYAAGI